MAPYLKVIVPALRRLDKSPTAYCSRCGFRGRCPRNGFYWRYFGEVRRKVQRYRCPNPECEAVTFSVLPLDALPIVRLGLGWMWLLMLMGEHWSKNQLARLFECGRATVRRRIAWARRFFVWANDSDSLAEASSWGAFGELVLRAFFPTRRGLKAHPHDMANS